MRIKGIIDKGHAYLIYSEKLIELLDDYLKVETTNCSVLSYKSKSPTYCFTPEEHWLYSIVDNNYIKISKGLLSFLPTEIFEFIDVSEIECIKLDHDYIRDCLPIYTLREDQVEAVEASLLHRRGINQMATGSGKTIIISALLKILINEYPDKKFLVIAPYKQIIDNIYETLLEVGIDAEIYSKSRKIKSPVVVANAMSLIKEHSIHVLKDFYGVFYDECQHCVSDTWSSLSKELINVQYSFGFSAKIVRDDFISETNVSKMEYNELLSIGATGRVIINRNSDYYISRGILATPVLFRIDNTLPMRLQKVKQWSILQKEGLNDKDRNLRTAYLAYMFAKYHRKTLILVATKNQAEEISSFLANEYNQTVALSFGGNKGFEVSKSNTRSIEGTEILSNFDNGKYDILIGTSHLDEGADIKSLDVCVVASAGKSIRRIIQKVGRVLRRTKSGKYAYLIDFMDKGSLVLNKHSLKRIEIYKEEIGIKPEKMYTSIRVEQVEETFKELEEIG